MWYENLKAKFVFMISETGSEKNHINPKPKLHNKKQQ